VLAGRHQGRRPHRPLLIRGNIGKLWDQSWGNLEFSVKDPDGNGICFAQDKNP